MFKGTVNFRAPFQGVAFESIDIKTHLPKTDGATLRSTQADGMLLRITVKDAVTQEEALEAARRVANRAARILTYHFDRYFKPFASDDYALVEEHAAGGPVHHLSQSVGLFMKVENECLNLNEQGTADLKKTLDLPKHPGSVYYSQFQAALSLRDPLARFMALYSIVLSLCNDSQEAVDIFVLSVDEATPTNAPFRPRTSGTPETVYTRLRNEVGHVRTGTTIDGTREEMAKNLPGLVKIAKMLIDRQP